MEIKIGDKFERTVDGELDSWKVTYTVRKVTAKTVTVSDDRFSDGHCNHELRTRKPFTSYNGKTAIHVTECSVAYLAN